MPTNQTIDSISYISGINRIESDSYITNTRNSLDSYSFIEGIKHSILCDGQVVDDIVNEFGVDVVLRVVSKSFEDEYGDAEETYSDIRTLMVIQTYTERDHDVIEGEFKSGEVVATFLVKDIDRVHPGNRVLYGGVWYEIDNVYRQPVMGIIYYLRATLLKI